MLETSVARHTPLGLDAPTKIAATAPDASALSFSQRQIHINAILTEWFGLAAVTLVEGASHADA